MPQPADPPPPRTIPWTQAADHVRAAANSHPNAAGSVVIGITGPVGSGKTTLAHRLSLCVVSTDGYLPDYDRVAYEDRDLPHAADLAGLARDLRALKRGIATHVPTWSFQTHKREGSRLVEPAALIVCEGIHALEATVLAELDMRVFIDAPAALRWDRWAALERNGERGWGVEVARRFFDEVAEPTFARFADGYRRAAEFVVVNDEPDRNPPRSR